MVPATSRSRTVVAQSYVALGDSFTAGAAGLEERSFAECLAGLLRRVNPELEFHNLAEQGALTAHIVSTQIERAVAMEPDVVTLICGGNDALLSIRPDVSAHVVALEQAVVRVRDELPDAAFAMATTPDPSRFLDLRPRTAKRITTAIEQINEATQATAARHGVPCLDFASHPLTNARELYADDGYHPTTIAAQMAAEAFAGVLGVRYGIQFDSEEVL
jgi:lysophospholipase L1-like esterase